MSNELATQFESVMDFAEELLELSATMMRNDEPHAVSVRAIATNIHEGLNKQTNKTV